MVSIVLSALLLSHKAPKWFDTTLAGYAFKYDEKHSMAGVHDPKTGFYLMRNVECDGGVLILTLTRDRNIVTGNGYKVLGFVPKTHDNGSLQLTEKPLPSLATGHGIRIGDSPAKIRAKLGAPTKIGRSGARKQWTDWHYVWRTGEHDETLKYEQRYTFKAGKLIEVEFSRVMDDLPNQ